MANTKPKSSQVTFQPSGAGAVTSTVQDKLRESVSVRDFGAVGNGVADDTAAIQAALSSGSLTVYFVTGATYKVTAPLTIPSNVTIQGNGANLTCTAAVNLLNFVSGGGVFDLRITGSAAGTYAAGSSAILCRGTNNAPAAPTYVTGPTVERCVISGFGEYGVFLAFVQTAKILSNTITNVGYAGIGGVSCNDITVQGNTIKSITPGSAGGDAYGVFIDRDNGTSEVAWPRSYRCVISNNTVEDVTCSGGGGGQGIDTHAGVDFIIDSNIVRNCQAGIYLTASVISGVQALAPLRCIVSNNTISGGYFGYGLIVYGARVGASVIEHATDCVVTGNIISGFGLKTSGTVPAMLVSVTKNLVVTGNIFKLSGGSNILLDYQNITFNISGNTFIDPVSTTYANAACILVYSHDQRGYIGNNLYRREAVAAATYVGINAIRIEPALSGLDIDFGRSMFNSVDGTNLLLSAATTAGIRYFGLAVQSGNSSIVVSSGVGDGITDVSFPAAMPYVPKISVTLRYPFNQGGKFPIVAVDTVVAPTMFGFRVYAKPADGTTWTATGSLNIEWRAE